MKRLINAIKHFGFGLKKLFRVDPTRIFSFFFSPVCKENANNLFWFGLEQFIYHSWNLKCHCLPRSTHQLPGTLFLGELGRSRGWRETTLILLWGGLLWGLGFWIQVVRFCGTHSTFGTWTRCRERWDLLSDQNKRPNKRHYWHTQDLPCLEDKAQSLLKHSSVLKGTVAIWPIYFRSFRKKKIRRASFHGLPCVWKNRQQKPSLSMCERCQGLCGGPRNGTGPRSYSLLCHARGSCIHAIHFGCVMLSCKTSSAATHYTGTALLE